MTLTSGRLALIFSCIGHAFMHMFTAMYFVIAVSMEKVGWQELSYADLVQLWSIGALLVGVAAIPSGWLADRWSASGMMVVFFLGLGGAAIVCGLVSGPLALMLGLAAIGVFAAIYHPVGIAWLVKSSVKRGRALGINGVFGSIGISVAGLVAGALIDLFSWRAAFIIPGVLSFVTGLALLWYRQRGLVTDAVAPQARPSAPPQRGEALRVYLVLLCTMLCMGLIFQATQAALPKHFDLRLGERLGDGAIGIGLAVAAVYTAGGIMQIAGGYLADRMNLKTLYVGAFFFQIPVMLGLAYIGGFALLPIAALTVLLSTGALPAENMMLARYTPERHQSLAYGLKFVLAFGSAPLAIEAVAWIKESSGSFQLLFLSLLALATIATAAALLLPRERPLEPKPGPRPEPVAAE
ncbi:MAG: MFS transporter [Rhodospirillales bacterium]